jgi:hypothetical protein
MAAESGKRFVSYVQEDNLPIEEAAQVIIRRYMHVACWLHHNQQQRTENEQNTEVTKVVPYSRDTVLLYRSTEARTAYVRKETDLGT